MLMENVAHLSRLTHIFFWSSVAAEFKVLLTPQGLSRLQSRGIIKEDEYQSLLMLRKEGAHFVCVTWLTTCIVQGAQNGHMNGASATLNIDIVLDVVV